MRVPMHGRNEVKMYLAMKIDYDKFYKQCESCGLIEVELNFGKLRILKLKFSYDANFVGCEPGRRGGVRCDVVTMRF